MRLCQKVLYSFGSKTATIFLGKPITTVNPSFADKDFAVWKKTLVGDWRE